MKNKIQYVYRVAITKIRGSNVLAPPSFYLMDNELKKSVLDPMEPGDEVVIKKITYEEFLASLPDKEVKE